MLFSRLNTHTGLPIPPSRALVQSKLVINRFPSYQLLTDPGRVVLPFKDQASADIVRAKLKYLSQEITIFVN